MKRYRRRKTKPKTLELFYGKSDDGEIGITYAWGEGLSKGCGALLHWLFSSSRWGPNGAGHPMEKSVLDELTAQGFDITTIKFSIEKAAETRQERTPA